MFAILFLAFATILQTFPGNMWGGVSRLYAAQNAAWFSSSSYNSINQTLQFNFSNETDYNKVIGVMVNDNTYESVTSTFSVTGNKYYKRELGYSEYYFLLPASLKAGDTVKFITNNGWYELTINNPEGRMGVHDKNSVRFVENTNTEPEPPKEPEQPKQSGKITLTVVIPSMSNDFYFKITPQPQADELIGVAVNDVAYVVASRKSSVGFADGGKNCFLEDGNLYILKPNQDENIIALTYKDGTKHSFNFKKSSKNGDTLEELAETPAPKVLKLRLRGYFEAAMVRQEKYDGVSSATLGGANSNKNSNVVLQVAEKEEPEEGEWKLFHELRLPLPKIVLDVASGMKGIYNSLDSTVTLNGIPAAKGNYLVKAVSKDYTGKEIESNALEFNVYDYDGTLKEYLDLEKYGKFFRKMQDGKYIWDMEPWVIQKFGGDNETVTVPKEVKAWYGSHTSGTYGELGFAAADEIPTQTLIVDKDTNLTLVNMKVLSSVNIVVKNGGILDLLDSSIHGKITVQDGGILRVNYNKQYSRFEKGASINGEIELKDGAVLENAKIYSNTNYLANGNNARHNVNPVVKVTGNATIKGKVFIRGDEAPTGTDPKTNEV